MNISKPDDSIFSGRFWLKLRWLVLALFFLYTLVPHEQLSYEYLRENPNLIYIFVSLGFLINLFHQIIFPKQLLTNKSIFVDSLVDIALISTIIWLTGAHESPFFFLYFLLIFGVAYTIDVRTALIEAAIISVLYSLIFLFEKSLGSVLSLVEIYEHFAHVVVVLASLWLVAYFAGYLTEFLKESLGKQEVLGSKYAKLYQKEVVNRRNLSIIYKISSMVNSASSGSITYSGVVEEISKALPFDFAEIYIFGRTRKTADRFLFSKSGRVVEKGLIKRQEFNPALLKEKITKESKLVNPSLINRALIKGKPISSCLLVPMVIGKKVIGSFCFLSSKHTAFNKTDMEVIEAIVGEVSVGVENANLYKELNRRAVRDSLTSVYNRGYFQQLLKRELAQAKRYQRSFSVIMLDVDGFKNFNDTYGHIKGDGALKKIGTILRKEVRDIDVVARYGGDEFIMILTGAERNTAQMVVERIAEAIQKQKFKGVNGEDTYFTVSMGIACYPNDATKAGELVRLADEFLYGEKALTKLALAKK